MEYINKNQLRKLMLMPEDFATPADIKILNQQLAASIVSIEGNYTSARVPPAMTGEGDMIAKQHLRSLEGIHVEITDLVALLPVYIKKILEEQDLNRIWPDESSLDISKNPLQDRYNNLQGLLGRCTTDLNTLRDILDVTERISLASERLYILDEPEDGANGLAQYENIHAQLCQGMQDDYKTHPAVQWGLRKLQEIREIRNKVSLALARIESAADLDQAFGKYNQVDLDSSHPLHGYYSLYKEFTQKHSHPSWIDWAHAELESLAQQLDPKRRTHWHYRIKFGKYLAGEKSIRTYLEHEKELISQIANSRTYCDTAIRLFSQNAVVDSEFPQGFLKSIIVHDKLSCPDANPYSVSIAYIERLLAADHFQAFMLYCQWLGKSNFDREEREKLESDESLENQKAQFQDFLSAFADWESVKSFCAGKSPPAGISIDNRSSKTLFGWICSIVNCLNQIPYPESGVPGASRWRREAYEELDQYRIRVVTSIRCARLMLEELIERKLRWDRAKQEVESQGRVWRIAFESSWIARRLKAINPDAEFDNLHEKICVCCKLAPRYDHYRTMYSLNCDPEKQPCQYMPH